MPTKKSSKKDFYCTVEPRKKNQRKGTMLECIEAKQVRLYGLYKIDPKLLKKYQDGKKKKKDDLPGLKEKRGALMGEFNRYKKDLTKDISDADKKKLKAKMDKIKVDFEAVQKKIAQLEAKKKQSRVSSRKSSRKSSKN